MIQYILGLVSAIVVIGACNSAPQPSQEVAKQEKPVPPPPPVDSSAKADSILKLHYNSATWKTTMAELTRWDSCAARQTDSSITYIQDLPKKWFPKRQFMAALDTMAYKNIYAYAKKAAKKYEAYKNPPMEQLIPSNDGHLDMMVKKPVIYLYPTAEQNITVRLGFNGSELYTWPKISAANEWSVTAKPDGMLTTADGEEYPYLFWEGKYKNFHIDYGEGFVVKATDTETFLTEKLKILGLNARERTDFITYWAPILKGNECNFIRFETDNYTTVTPLTITPAPESIQRICMVYGKVHASYIVTEQPLKPFIRKGYTVVEWGGLKTVLY